MNRASNDLPFFAWRPPSRVLPFPSVKRRAFIARNAMTAAGMKPKARRTGFGTSSARTANGSHAAVWSLP